MSRARLFKRAADWLKNCVKTKEKIAEAKDRQRAFRFAFGQLEERVVLDADFSFNGVDLVMDNYTSLGSEELNVSDTGTHFEFALAEGVWNGIDSPFAFGDGTDTLSLDKVAFPASITSDGAGIDLNFNTVDFDSALLLEVSFRAENVTQSGSISAAGFSNFVIDANDVNLLNASNDFSTVDLTAVAGIDIRDANDIAVTARANGLFNTNVLASGNIDFSGDNLSTLSEVILNSTIGGSNGDITIADTSALQVGITAGTGNVDASDTDNHSDNWIILSAGDVTLFDSGDTTLDVFSATSLSVEAGDVEIGDIFGINVTSAFFDVNSLSSSSGIIATELTINTVGDAILSVSGNAIENIAGTIGGNLDLLNFVNLNIAELTFGAITTTGLNVTGDVDIEMVDLDLVSVQPIVVGGASQFTLGLGSATLDHVDNDFNSVEVVSSDSFVLFDANALAVTAANGNDLSFESVDGTTLNGDLIGANTVSLVSGGGVDQAGGIINSPDLTLAGSGLFNLISLNDIGSGGTGLLDVLIDGDLNLTNENAIEFSRNAGVTGDVSVTLSDDDLTQAADTPVRFGGTSTFTVGLGDICLDGGDDTPDAINDNDLNIVNIVSADVAEIVEFDGFTLNDATLTDRAILETVAGDLGLTGTIVSPNGLLLISGGAISQSAGTIDASTLLVDSTGDAVLDQLNSIGTGLPAGVIAGVSGGDFVVTNSLTTLVGTVTINRKDGSPKTLVGVEALNFKLTALQILVNAATTATENIVLDSENGVTQNADGILKAAGLVLAGEGDFDLTQDNEIGTLVDPGKFAASVLGSISLTNLYGLMIAKISCGAMVYTGVNLGAGAGTGDLVLNTSANDGDVSQEDDAPIIVAGSTRFNVGAGTICLTKGDSDSDTVTNNDLNTLFVDAATIAEIADANGLVTEDIVALEKISLDAAGAIHLNNSLEADTVRLKAGAGVTQTASTFVDALELLLQGEGDFTLTESNRIGGTFTEGRIAADISGSLNIVNDFDLVIDEIVYTFKDATTETLVGINIDVGGSTGDLTIVNSNDDVRQTAVGSVVVLGMTSIDAGTGSIYLNMSTNNNLVEFEVINSSEVELGDSVDDLLIGDLNATTQALLVSDGLMTLEGDIVAVDRLATISNGGVRQGFVSTLLTSELIVAGTGTFTFDRGNLIESIATGIGSIAVGVDGDFELVNANETVVRSLTYSTDAGFDIDVVGVDVSGDFMIQLPDVDFHQDPDAAFIVGGTSTLNVGLGCVDLSFGDEAADGLNENNFNIVEITAAEVNLVDVDGFILGENVVSDRMRIESQSGEIEFDRNVRVTNQLLIVSAGGLSQNIGASIETPELLVTGSGDFLFSQSNLIGNAGSAGQVAASVDGSLLLNNSFDVNFTSLTYTNKDASTVDIVGVSLLNTSGTGDMTIEGEDITVTQDVIAPVIVAGLSTFEVGNNGIVNLPFSDTDDTDMLDINENDFNTVAINLANVVELNDINDITMVGAVVNNRMAITSNTGEIFLDGNVDVGNVVKFNAAAGLSQLNGTVESDSLLLVGNGYFDLSNPNKIGEDFGSSSFAADVSGDINFVNANRVVVTSVSYTDLAGTTTTAVGVGPGVGGTLSNFGLDANGIQLLERTEADTVVFETSAGISQSVDAFTDGIIDANDFSLVGFGLANLTENNLIGSGSSPADVAIDFEGDVRLTTLFGVDFDAVNFDMKDGSTRTDEHVDITAIGNASGNFELIAGGNITDAATTSISVAGRTALSANDGAGNIVLGDRFSSSGGFNNVTNFGTIGAKGNNVDISEDSGMMLDGMSVAGDLDLAAFGSIAQTGEDPFSMVGGEGLQVEGTANFLVDALQEATNHLNDNLGRDVLLMSDANDELIDNFFAGLVNIEGTASTGELNGAGTLRNIHVRNSQFENSAFPVINAPNDPLRAVSVWAPNSSLEISNDLDVLLNLTVRAGVDSNNGILGGNLELTNAALNRRITDASGVSISVGQNAVFETSNSVILANTANDVLSVGGRLQTSTHGGDAGSRVRVGIANNAPRGEDSGATVNAQELRFRAKRTTLENSEHASFNIDNAVEIVGANVARSLMLVAEGGITDDSDAKINVKNSTTLVAENDSDILLGESFSTNFVNNNVHNFGALAIKAGNADITEDSAVLLDGISVTGDLAITAKGHIRQTGLDRFEQVGTEFIKVDGDATFRVDKELLAVDHLNDFIGQDVLLLANIQKQLMDNEFMGNVIITSTDFDNSQHKKGSVRNVEIRNVSETATMPVFNLTNVDTVRNLHIWVPNSSFQLRNSMTIEKDFRVFAGIDSSNGLRNGRLQISNNLAERNLRDVANVNFRVNGNMDFRSSNFIRLADNATDSYVVSGRSTFITLGGGLGNEINVGVDPSAARGTDSGANFETDVLKYRAPINGSFGLVTISVDGSFTVTADSQARSAVVN